MCIEKIGEHVNEAKLCYYELYQANYAQGGAHERPNRRFMGSCYAIATYYCVM